MNHTTTIATAVFIGAATAMVVILITDKQVATTQNATNALVEEVIVGIRNHRSEVEKLTARIQEMTEELKRGE